MTRIPLMEEQALDPSVRDLFARMMARGGRVPDLYRLLANAPDMLLAWTELAWPLRTGDHTDRALRELLILRTSQLTGAQYEWAHHWPLAVNAGVSEAKLHALSDWRSSDVFDAAERAALAFCDALVSRQGVPDADYNAFAEQFSAAQQIHLVLTIAFYVCVALTASAFELDLEPEYASIAPLPAATIMRPQ